MSLLYVRCFQLYEGYKLQEFTLGRLSAGHHLAIHYTTLGIQIRWAPPQNGSSWFIENQFQYLTFITDVQHAKLVWGEVKGK